MELYLNDFIDFTNMVDSTIKKTNDKLKTYSTRELEIRGGSNFSVDLTAEEMALPDKIIKKFGKFKNIKIDNYLVNELYAFKEDFSIKINEFNNSVDERFKNIENQPSEISDVFIFSSWMRPLINCLDRVSNCFSKELSLDEVISMKDAYKELINASQVKNDELSKLYSTAIEETNKLKLELETATQNLNKTNIVIEQDLTNKKVLDIADFYQEYREYVNNGKNLYGLLYFGLSVILIGVFILIFWKLDTLFENSETLYLKISKSIISCSVIGFATFIVNDFRRRHNICKQILDEIDQKIAIVKTYSSLLSRIDEFDDEIKKQYHQKVLQNIIDTLLSIKNHGFLSKSFQQSSPSITATATELVEQISKLLPNK